MGSMRHDLIREGCQDLRDRMGYFSWDERVRMECDILPKKRFRNLTHNALKFHHFLTFGLKCLGLYHKGNEHFKDIQVVQNCFVISKLPESFNGFRILQLTDLHVDLEPGVMLDVLSKILPDLEYDLCVMTGDFRNGEKIDNQICYQEMEAICKLIKTPIYSVLGNHDSICMVKSLENIGMQFLLNESAPLRRGQDVIYLVGIDDPEFFKSDDLEKACSGLSDHTVNLLLSHGPVCAKRAADYPIDLMLSGHTHGGQICLPGGVPVLTSSQSDSMFVQGAWRYKRVQGYTSRGTGACKIPFRLNCPAEVTIHTLSK